MPEISFANQCFAAEIGVSLQKLASVARDVARQEETGRLYEAGPRRPIKSQSARSPFAMPGSVLVPGKGIEDVIPDGEQFLLQLHVVVDGAVSDVGQLTGDDRSIERSVSFEACSCVRSIDHGRARAVTSDFDLTRSAVHELENRRIVGRVSDALAFQVDGGGVTVSRDVYDHRAV